MLDFSYISQWKARPPGSDLGLCCISGLQKLGLSFVDPDKFTDHGFGLIGAGFGPQILGIPRVSDWLFD